MRSTTPKSPSREAVATLRSRGVNGVILGCTGDPLPFEDPDADPTLINPAEHLAETAVRAAIDG